MTGLQLSLDDAVPAVRATDPWTSKAAGQRVSQNASNTRARVLRALVDHWQAHREGLTLQIPSTSAGKRRLELQRAGLVELADGVGTPRNGAAALMWQPTDQGVDLASGLSRRVVNVPTGGRL